MGPEGGGESRFPPAWGGLGARVEIQLDPRESPRPQSVGFCGGTQPTKRRQPAHKALPPSGHPLPGLSVVTLTRPLLSRQDALLTTRQPTSPT